MIYEQRVPPPPLDQFVEVLFYVRGYAPEHRIERLVPDGGSNLVIELDGQQRFVADNETHEPLQQCVQGWLSTIRRNYISISALPDTELAAVRFHPGGLFPLLKQPIDEIADRVVPGEDILGGRILQLRDELILAKAPNEKLDVLEHWLTDNVDTTATPPPAIADAINEIQAQPTLGRLDDLVTATGYSRKQFIHLFKKHVGLPPKVFQRILRFGQVLALVQNQQSVSWAALSVECGYTDQSHFIKDFQEFSGFNPAEFLSDEPDRVNFFPVDRDPNREANESKNSPN